MERLDALFVHAPLWRGGRREIMVMPLGLPALANLLADEGRKVSLIHLGIESEVAAAPSGEKSGASFSLRELLEAERPRMVLLSLHWNQQTKPVIDLAQKVRAWIPECKIVLGGLTASVFAEEAMASLRFLDAVVKGDGEEPLRRLAKVWLDGEGELGAIPNLIWRESSGEIRTNESSWVLDNRTAATLRHGDLSLLRHYPEYLSRSLYADFSPGARGSEGYPFATYLNAGRGCNKGCICCGGATESQLLTSRRRGYLLYPLDKLAADLRDAAKQGAQVIRSSFDPPGSREHIIRWFERMFDEGHRFRLIYDLWELPTDELLTSIARFFDSGSTVVFSPECGNERVRASVRPPGWSNDALLAAIRGTEDVGIATHCFFTAGLPGETASNVDETARLIERIRSETSSEVSVTPMYVDPASPIWIYPERYGVRLLRKGLADFYDVRGGVDGPGYETEHFDAAGILEACRRLLAVSAKPV